MSDSSAQMLVVLEEMRDLLRLMAEPAIAQRDKNHRETLLKIAGSATGKKTKAIQLMDGSKTQAAISSASGIDQGDLSNLVKKLRTAGLLSGDPKRPQLTISLPANFFEKGGASE
jgi:hypothetical protein